jgi:hypothetical protein
MVTLEACLFLHRGRLMGSLLVRGARSRSTETFASLWQACMLRDHRCDWAKDGIYGASM